MSEEKTEKKNIKEKPEKKHIQKQELREERLVRILGTDVPGSRKIFVGLTRIKGVSWSFASAICSVMKIDKNRQIASLTKEEVDQISETIKNPESKGIPIFLLNSRKDIETGNTSHEVGSDLDMKKEFDIKRLKKIRSYRGWRHATGQPTRGQRTKSHFRKAGKKKAVGVMTSKPKPDKAKQGK